MKGIKVSKKDTLANGLIEITSSILDKTTLKTVHKEVDDPLWKKK